MLKLITLLTILQSVLMNSRFFNVYFWDFQRAINAVQYNAVLVQVHLSTALLPHCNDINGKNELRLDIYCKLHSF